ncbi:putative dehydrogenase [Devosia sp. UYZn731]|uniref:Gfo/Idh/MocA family protein n=1 Tax=Devosia sp. UYZn731 TaxID=3156345 RepID=UPI003391AC31
MTRYRVAAINFDHMHMGDLLREVAEHEDAEIVGICDTRPERMATAIDNFGIAPEQVFTEVSRCIQTTRPDMVILCPATADHAAAVDEVAAHGVNILIEKPFAASLADADRMSAAMALGGGRLAINWPLAWYPPHVTTKRLVDRGAIGDVIEVHFYDGNRGPLYHLADKVEVSDTGVQDAKPGSWWYKAASGGGSMLDYLGYGATLGTWYMSGRAPLSVTSVADQPAGLEVDEHSITICHYDTGLSKFETRWGTLSDPWTLQPQPKCGFVVVGTEGSISSYDFESYIGLQTRTHPEVRSIPVDQLQAPFRKPVEYVIDRWRRGMDVQGPLNPTLSRIGQRIVDTAALSASQKRTLELLP